MTAPIASALSAAKDEDVAGIVERAFASLETLADEWASESDLSRSVEVSYDTIVGTAASKMPGGPERARAILTRMVRQAYMEGVYFGRRSHGDLIDRLSRDLRASEDEIVRQHHRAVDFMERGIADVIGKREACAQIAESFAPQAEVPATYGARVTARSIADAIRSRPSQGRTE